MSADREAWMPGTCHSLEESISEMTLVGLAEARVFYIDKLDEYRGTSDAQLAADALALIDVSEGRLAADSVLY